MRNVKNFVEIGKNFPPNHLCFLSLQTVTFLFCLQILIVISVTNVEMLQWAYPIFAGTKGLCVVFGLVWLLFDQCASNSGNCILYYLWNISNF